MNSFTKLKKKIRRSSNAPDCDAGVKISNPTTSPAHFGLPYIGDRSLRVGGGTKNARNKNEKFPQIYF
jgi:hypothetical protein